MSAAHRHEVLQDNPGKNLSLLGNLAIVRGALEAGIQFYSCYPGTPSSEIGDTFSRIAHPAQLLFEYSVNEKVALEIAFAASLAGARAMCGMKHLGLNYAADPLSTIPYVGVEGGMVIVSAGDPSLITSPNEQDQRHFSRFLHLPVFDPATPEDARRMTRYAFEFSETTRLPAMLRPTTRICHSTGMVELGPLPRDRNEIRFTKNPSRHVPIPGNARRMRKELSERFRQAERMLAESGFFPRTGSGKRGIVASGVAYAYARQALEDLGLDRDVTLQQIGAYPIPDAILDDLLDGVDSLLVFEELTPFVEDEVSLHAFRRRRDLPVLGKRSGHLPMEFEYTPDLVEDAIREVFDLDRRPRASVSVPELPSRPPVLCAGCPHRTSFYLTRKVFGKKTVYCNDIGCYTLGYGEPLQACDVLLCMGSSISQASGIARVTGERTVAFIGDSTFFHSGIPPLANAARAGDKVTVVILDNHITAMTGFQPSPTGDPEAAGRIIDDAVRGAGVTESYSVDPFDEEAALEALRSAKRSDGTNVIAFHAPCSVEQRRHRMEKELAAVVIDEESCNACSLCIRVLGCPCILVVDGKYVIDAELCGGCGLCVSVCAHDAIRPAVPE